MGVSTPVRTEVVAAVDLADVDLPRLLSTLEALGDSLDPGIVLTKVAAAARELLEADTSTLSLLDESGERLRVVAHVGLDATIAEQLATPLGENLAGRVCATGLPVRSLDIDADDRTEMGAVCDGRVCSAILVPLVRDGNVLGTLGVQSRRMRRFDDRDECVLRLLADRGTTAIETARKYSVAHDRVELLRGRLEQLSGQNDVMRQSREAHDRLTRAVLEGGGLAALLDVLTDSVSSPLVVVNQFGIRLGPRTDDECRERLWADCEGSAGFLREIERIRQNGEPRPPARGRSRALRIFPVSAGAEVMGAIVALDPAELDEADTVILDQASGVIATELLRERSVAEVEARSQGDLIQTLTAGDDDSLPARQKAALLGQELAEELVVVAIAAVAGSALPEPGVLTSAGRRAFAQVGLHGLCGMVDGGPVALLSAGDRSLSRKTVEAWIASFGEQVEGRAEAVELNFGVSEIPCRDGMGGTGLAQARQAIGMCRLAPDQTVACFDDVQLIATLIDITNDEAIERYIDRTIGRLEDYDRRKRTHLAQTLETYLDCSGVARHAAKALYLHPHSLRYRLRRIAEIQEIDLRDPMVRLTCHLALKLRAVVAPAV